AEWACGGEQPDGVGGCGTALACGVGVIRGACGVCAPDPATHESPSPSSWPGAASCSPRGAANARLARERGGVMCLACAVARAVNSLAVVCCNPTDQLPSSLAPRPSPLQGNAS